MGGNEASNDWPASVAVRISALTPEPILYAMNFKEHFDGGDGVCQQRCEKAEKWLFILLPDSLSELKTDFLYHPGGRGDTFGNDGKIRDPVLYPDRGDVCRSEPNKYTNTDRRTNGVVVLRLFTSHRLLLLSLSSPLCAPGSLFLLPPTARQ